jgi:DNA-binding IclR family transcriptional regulator
LSEDPSLERLQQFLFERIATYEELEILLLLLRREGLALSLADVAKELGASNDDCRTALQNLERQGLLARAEEPPRFRYAPSDAVLAQRVAELATAYRDQRILIIQMMNRNAVARVKTAAIRTFADAFRLRGPNKK